MKTVKRVFAIAVAVLLIAMMIPSAFAAGSNTVNWTCEYTGYTYTVYKVAGYNATTGAYPVSTSATTQTAVNAAVTESQMASLASTLQSATFASGDVETTFTTSSSSGNFTVADGIYFIKCTTPGPNNKAILKDSIVVFPNADKTTTETINLTDKVNEGEPTVTKEIKNGGDNTFGTVDTTAKQKTITYVLTADIAGSAASKLTSYVITDNMGTGLKSVTKDNIVSVELKPAEGDATTLTKDTQWTFTTDSAVINCAQNDTVDKKHGTTGNSFGISIAKSVLDTDAFYTEGNKVVVTFTTEIDYATAACGTDIPNTDDMIYGNAAGKNVVPGNTVNVKTYQPYALKKDANTHAALTGKSATFGLYEDQACTKEIATAQTNTQTGIADFAVKLPAGTYYIKETVAPDGYNLNSEVKSVTLGGTTGTATVDIEDTPAKLPATGGTGTLVFTIVGGSLVLLAAALFVIVMKKRSSAK
ncbi:MAG: LPXTG cell wall anchor domain-containing protein [Ruminococcus sp.]|nr:LPXTG cell wall anchor domain-containing protein [Ruminococcus sp.]